MTELELPDPVLYGQVQALRFTVTLLVSRPANIRAVIEAHLLDTGDSGMDNIAKALFPVLEDHELFIKAYRISLETFLMSDS